MILRSKTVAISNNSYYSTAIVLTLNMAFEVTKYAQLASLTWIMVPSLFPGCVCVMWCCPTVYSGERGDGRSQSLRLRLWPSGILMGKWPPSLSLNAPMDTDTAARPPRFPRVAEKVISCTFTLTLAFVLWVLSKYHFIHLSKDWVNLASILSCALTFTYKLQSKITLPYISTTFTMLKQVK